MFNPAMDQDRVHHLAMRQEASARRALLPAWPRPDKELRVVSLEVDWVRFSTLNHRTKSEQMRVITQSGRSDLFTADPLGVEAQAEQYAILRGQDGFEDIKSDLKERGQQQPAVVTAEGVLINGNRRVAALRSLYLDDKVKSARYVMCLVLPADATMPELVDLETELQIAREFKEDYTWVNEALLIEEIFNREQKDWNRVSSRMHKTSNEVRTQYEKLQQLHQLVDLSNGTRHHADFVDNESAFTELAGYVRNKPAEEAASVRSAYFLGILTGVNYRSLRNLRRPDASTLVRSEIANNVTLAPLLEQQATDANDDLDILDDVLGEKPNALGGDLNGVLSFFASQGGKAETAFNGSNVSLSALMSSVGSAVDVAAEEASAQQQDGKAVTAPVGFVTEAIGKITKAAKALPKARTLVGWKEADFKAKLDELKAALSDLEVSA
ncbi:ParB/RepB/Spo0J family partition protein [Mesorhizobium caraganae]|uniref:ParB/RepB/Spo0J family partition protein n=1 Tax=Mesorhizobium caraganae TaxID=483206 RepID=UPI00178719F3|nr:ParB/RepB/Spo0J family partition protein [Mesorhizobium caraganae]